LGRVIVLGSIITDLVARAPRLPLPGEALIGDSFATFLGGKGINQAIAAARLGAQVSMIGRVGTDTFGDAFFLVLEQEGVDSTYVTRDTTVGTGVALIIIAANTGQNMIVPTPLANLAVTAEAVEQALQAAQAQRQPGETPIFLTQCETSNVSFVTGIKRARELGMLTILNAAPVPREPFADDLYTFLDILIVNEVEAAAFAQSPVTSPESAQTAAEILLSRGARNVIITLGPRGSLWCARSEPHGKPVCQVLPAFKVKAIDTTAAGDTFCGALAASLSNGMSMPDALRLASAAGAIATTRMGAILSLPTAAEVQELLSQET
jgi:ribokinase